MNYYCATKFTDLQVHVQGRLLYNCCKAYPERINLKWLEDNPGSLFHTETMIADRKLMLDNKSCASCHHGCYKYEQQGLVSQRLTEQNKEHINNPYAQLKRLQIILSTDCNLACVYCSPEWSSTWYNDIKDNGDFKLEGQSIGNDSWSTLWSRLKQKNRSTETKFFEMLLKEIELAKGLQDITMLGGEPLLHNQLLEILQNVRDKRISIVTGLGVNDQRLQKILAQIGDQKIKFLVSAESTGKYFEFIRYGLKWEDFQKRVRMIESAGHKVEFISTLSNLAYMDIHNFLMMFQDRFKIQQNGMTGRDFMLPHVMDDESKDECRKQFALLGNKSLSDAIDKEPTEIDRKNIANYLAQISKRRGVDLNFLPKHFLKWCELTK